jgi:Amt family ammonium transporter
MDGALWAVVGGVGALLMRAGLAVSAVGMSRSKNCAGMVIRHVADLCVGVLAFWAIGIALLQSDNRFLGLDFHYLLGWSVEYWHAPGVLLGIGAVAIATGIVPGVLAERSRFWPGLGTAALLGGVVVPVARFWVSPAGWLGKMDFHDLAGAATVHWPAALCAAVGAMYVGPRTGKFNKDGSSTAIPGHSVPLAGFGVLVLLVGWVAYVGAHSPMGAVNLLIGSAAGGLASVVLSQSRHYKPDVHLTCAGVVGALVALSAGADQLRTFWAVVVGGVAGVIVPMGILILDVRLRIDDPTGGVAMHGLGAAWGILATPLLATGSTFAERLKNFGVHVLGLAVIGVLAVGLSVALWTVLKRSLKLRLSEADEFDGLDLAEHDIGAYPDFQQNTIKSYHLREV